VRNPRRLGLSNYRSPRPRVSIRHRDYDRLIA
jgi:hypothetical protein